MVVKQCRKQPQPELRRNSLPISINRPNLFTKKGYILIRVKLLIHYFLHATNIIRMMSFSLACAAFMTACKW